MNYIIGAITDYNLKDIEPWVVSLDNVVNDNKTQKVMMVYNSTREVVDFLMERNYEIWMVGQPDESGINFHYKDRRDFNICLDRFKHVHDFLLKKDDVQHVVMTDVKDVIFQKNPIDKMFFSGYDNRILLSKENLRYSTEPWGMNNMKNSFGEDVYERMKNFEIYNAGVIAGYGRLITDFFLAVYYTAKSTGLNYVIGGGGPDQAALNIVARMEAWDKNIYSDMKNWAVQAGTTNDPSKIELFKDNWIDPHSPVLDPDSQKIVDPFWQKPYNIVHQYDRVPEWNTLFKEKYTYEN